MTDAPAATPTAPTKRERVTYMLHDSAGAQLGKYQSTNPRNAALKAVSRNCKTVDDATVLNLRQTNSRICKVFIGIKKTLDKPQVVTRAGRDVTYLTKPSALFVREFEYGKDELNDEQAKEAIAKAIAKAKARAEKRKLVA